MHYSPLIQNLIDSLRALPGVGPKSAQRMALYLLERNPDAAQHLEQSLHHARIKVGRCESCRTLTEEPICQLCRSQRRVRQQLCVVESPSDLISIEQTGVYQGLYYVLMGHLSPIDGIGPNELGLDLLADRLAQGEVTELILATNPTLEGRTTADYIAQIATKYGIVTSVLAQGLPMGGELEYVDSATLSFAFSGRKSFAS